MNVSLRGDSPHLVHLSLTIGGGWYGARQKLF